MTEILTESFCERCGTRYTFESAAPATRRLGGLKVLGRGLKQFVMSDTTSLDEAIASARSEVERDATNQQLDAFHRTFSFCMSCRQYTCANCWNEAEARCQSCAPLASVQDVPYGTDGLAFDAADGMIGLEPETLHVHTPAIEVPSPFTDAWTAPPPIEFAGTPTPAADPAPADPIAAEDIWIGTTESDQDPAAPALVDVPAAGAAEVVPEARTSMLGDADGDGSIDAESAEAWAHRPEVAYFADGRMAPEPDPDDPTVGDLLIGAADDVGDIAPVGLDGTAWPAADRAASVDPEVATTPMAPVIDDPVVDEEVAAPSVRESLPADTVPQPAWPAAPATTPEVRPRPATHAAAPAATPGRPHGQPAPAPQWPTSPRWPTGGKPAASDSPAIDALAALMSRKTTDAMWAASNREILQPMPEAAPLAAVKACASCGTSLSANARFCRRCGTSQA